MSLNLDLTTARLGIKYCELNRGDGSSPESPNVSGSSDGAVTVVRQFACRWSDWKAFVGEHLGGPTAGFVWYNPIFDKDLVDLPATKFAVKGWGKARGAPDQASFNYAQVQITFGDTGADKSLSGVLGGLTEALEYTAEMITMPHGSFCFTPSSTIYDEDGVGIGSIGSRAYALDATVGPAKLMPTATYTLTLDRHPTPPWTDIGNLLGKVNSSIFAPLAVSFAVGRLLFLGASTQRHVSRDPTNGSSVKTWSLSYRFAFRRIPWNFSYNTNTQVGTKQGWAELRETTSNKPPFQGGDLTLLY